MAAWREDVFVLISASDAVSASRKAQSKGLPDTHRATPSAATPAVRRLAIHPSLVRAGGPGALPVSAAARRHRPALSGCIPYYYPTWQPTAGLVAPEEERALAALRAPEPGSCRRRRSACAPRRATSLHRDRAASSSSARPSTGSWGTGQRGGLASAAELPDAIDIVTPSRWCALAYERFGIPPARIHVVPHGIDPDVLARPDAVRRTAARGALHIERPRAGFPVGRRDDAEQGHRSAARRFCAPAASAPDVRLVLKGADGLYPSRDFVRPRSNELLARRARGAHPPHDLHRRHLFVATRWPICIVPADVYVSAVPRRRLQSAGARGRRLRAAGHLHGRRPDRRVHRRDVLRAHPQSARASGSKRSCGRRCTRARSRAFARADDERGPRSRRLARDGRARRRARACAVSPGA